MISLSTVAQSSATAVTLRPSLLLKHIGVNGNRSGFGIDLVKLIWVWDKYVFGTAAAFRAPESNGIAKIRTGRNKAALRATTKSSIAAAPSLQSTQLRGTWWTHLCIQFKAFILRCKMRGTKSRGVCSSLMQRRSQDTTEKISASSRRESGAWRVSNALANKSIYKLEHISHKGQLFN